MDLNRSEPKYVLEINMIADMLKALPIGGVITYSDISARVGFDIQSRGYVLMRARRLAEETGGHLFTTIPRNGVQKIDAKLVPEIGAAARKRVRSTAKRAFSRLGAVKYNDLTNDQRLRISAERAVLSTIHAAADGNVLKKVEKSSNQVLADVLAAMKERI